MEITEKERLMLVEKKEEIRELTERIIELSSSFRNAEEIKQCITGILSLLSTIASYSDSKNYDLNKITELANLVCEHLKRPSDLTPFDKTIWHLREASLARFCNIVNSISFDFTKKGIKINVPKIDITIFRHG